MLRTTAYAWEKGGTKQVVYRAPDGHIHELFVSVGRSWRHADLTQLTGAPPPDPDSAFAGYQWDAGGTKQVVYITSDGHIHELFVAVGGSWSHADLTQLAGAPPIADAVSFVGYQWKAGGTKQVAFLTSDSHVHELFVGVGGSWSHADLTRLAGAPSQNMTFPVIAAYEWESGETKQVVYRPTDGHVHELFVGVGGSWSHADLTQISRSPVPDFASAYSGFGWKDADAKQVVYVTGDGHIHELFVPVGGSWSHADLMQITGAPRPQPDTAFAGYEWKAGGTKQIVYRTEDGNIHELFVAAGDSWAHADLSLLTDAPPANTNSPVIHGYEWEAGNTKQVVYLTPNGHIHELFVAAGDAWSHADLTQIAGAPPAV